MDGMVTLCTLENTASNGDMPVEKLIPQWQQFFGERTLGINRAYLAKGVDERIDMVIRIHDEGHRPNADMFAILTDYAEQEETDGDQFRISLVQKIIDDDGLKAYDLTLTRLEKNYAKSISQVTKG